MLTGTCIALLFSAFLLDRDILPPFYRRGNGNGEVEKLLQDRRVRDGAKSRYRFPPQPHCDEAGADDVSDLLLLLSP